MVQFSEYTKCTKNISDICKVLMVDDDKQTNLNMKKAEIKQNDK